MTVEDGWWSGVMSISKVITYRNPLVVGMCTFSDAEFRYIQTTEKDDDDDLDGNKI